MSKEKVRQSKEAAEDHLQELRVDSLEHSRRHSHSPVQAFQKGPMPKMSSRSTDYVYVNQAYVGSTQNLQPRISPPPVTSEVIREQYWACSKWPIAQRILAIAVGLLLGAVVGLVVSMVIKGKDAEEVIGGLFNTRSVPD